MLGIYAIELAHALRQICLDRFNEQMIMIAHLAETMHDKMIPFTHQRQHFLPGNAVSIIAVNCATPVSARSNVVEGTGELKS